MCWVTECGGFKTCPQIFRNTSFQEVRLNFPPLECELDLATHLIGRQKWQCMLLPELGYQEHCNFLLTLTGITRLSGVGCHAMRMLRSPYEEDHMTGKPGLLTTALCGHHLDSVSSSPNQDVQRPQPTSWLKLHERPSNQIRQLNHSWTPDPQKLWNNKYSLLVEVTTFWDKLLSSNRFLMHR